jgi:hypothetical protein
MNINDFLRLINGSIRYEFEGTKLTITGYYSGKGITLDLSKMTEEMLEELTADEDEEL